MNTYIKHYGIQGMHWGVRNGPPYPLTSRQMSSSERKAKKRTVAGGIDRNDWSRTEVTPGKNPRDPATMTTQELQDYNKRVAAEDLYKKNTTKPNRSVETTNQVANAARQASNALSTAADNAYKDAVNREKSKIDLSSMSDEELRQRVNRMNMERQYKDLTPVEIKTGEEKFKKVMDILGPIVATAASAATIVATVAMLGKGKGK